jgi:hypothetical protein
MTATFAIPVRVNLTAQQRRRLAHLLRQRDQSASDYVSALIEACDPHRPIVPSEPSEPTERIPLVLMISPAQRDAIMLALAATDQHVSEWAGAILAEALTEAADPPPEPVTPPDPRQQRRLRRELRQLQQQRANLGEHAPTWLDSYIADLLAELEA